MDFLHRIGWGVCLCVLLFAPNIFAAGYDLPVSGQANVREVQGNVQLMVGDMVTSLVPGDNLNAPSRVKVGADSRLEIILADGSILRFAPTTEFTLVRADATPEKSRHISVDVAMGDCWAKVQQLLGTDSSFDVNSPTAVAGVAGTVYRLHVETSKASQYYVYDGKIAVSYSPTSPPANSGVMTTPHRVQGPSRVAGPHRVSLEKWLVIVSRGYRFDISPKGQYADPTPFDLQKDQKNPWVEWNMERDSRLDF